MTGTLPLFEDPADDVTAVGPGTSVRRLVVGEIGPFDYSSRRVRAITRDGEPWFVAADVCAVLGIANVGNVLARLDDDEKGSIHLADGTPGNPNRAIVNESGLYSLILRSDKPEAKTFKRWVTHEVLPQIRKTGSYGVPALPDISTPTGVLAMAEQFATTARALVAADEKIAELTPKAELADTYLIADKATRLVREAAQLLGMREIDLRRFLVDEGFVFVKHAQCGVVMYDYYAQYAHHFVATETVINHSWGTCSHYTLQVTPRGIDLVRKRLAAAKGFETERRGRKSGGPASALD